MGKLFCPYNIWTFFLYGVWKKGFSIQHIDNLYICFMDKTLCPYNIYTNFPYAVWENFFVHTTYGQVFYLLYGQVVYICHIDKDMSDDTEKVHNESMDMTYLRKIYMNIAPTGHNISEHQNISYSVLLGFTPPGILS